MNDPDSRTWFNYMFTAAGILPGIPAASQVKMARDKIKGSQLSFDPAKRYPQTGEPELRKDPKSGKEFYGKSLSPEELEVQALRQEINKDIKAGDYEPMFPVEERFYADPSRYDFEGDTLVDTLAKTDVKRAEKMEQFYTPEAKQKLVDAFESGLSPKSQDWYAMGQLEEEFIRELGPELGPQMFKERFADAMAATTGGADPGANLLMAAYGNYLRTQGKSPPTNAFSMPHPIGGRYVTGNMKMYDKVINQSTPLTTTEQPKRHNFSANFLGDLNRATIDEQMSGGLHGVNAPPNLTYGVFEKIVHDVAAEKGVKAAEGVNLIWTVS